MQCHVLQQRGSDPFWIMNQKPDSCETDVRYGLLKASRLRKSSYDHLIPTMIQKLKNLRLWSYDVRDFAIHHDQRQSSRTHFHSLPISGRQSSKKKASFSWQGQASVVQYTSTKLLSISSLPRCSWQSHYSSGSYNPARDGQKILSWSWGKAKTRLCFIKNAVLISGGYCTLLTKITSRPTTREKKPPSQQITERPKSKKVLFRMSMWLMLKFTYGLQNTTLGRSNLCQIFARVLVTRVICPSRPKSFKLKHALIRQDVSQKMRNNPVVKLAKHDSTRIQLWCSTCEAILDWHSHDGSLQGQLSWTPRSPIMGVRWYRNKCFSCFNPTSSVFCLYCMYSYRIFCITIPETLWEILDGDL